MADRNQNMFVKKLQAVGPSMLCLGGIKETTGKGGPPLQCWIHGANSFSCLIYSKPLSNPVYYMHEGFYFDLNEIPMDEDVLIVQEADAIDDESHNENEYVGEPFVGQCFLSEEEALAFYQKYARMGGFSVRKGRFENKKGENKGERKRRDVFCHCEGKPDVKLVDYSKKQRNQGSARCECKAMIHEVRFLPSYRKLTIEDEKRILLLREGGLSVRQIMRVMELERNVRHGGLNFLVKDVHNFFTKKYKAHSQNNARDLLQYCKNAKIENHNFQYDLQLMPKTS
ncbi:protein FAR1-related sequence 11 [Tanacetum coccineum]